jgi:hypothetical protein
MYAYSPETLTPSRDSSFCSVGGDDYNYIHTPRHQYISNTLYPGEIRTHDLQLSWRRRRPLHHAASTFLCKNLNSMKPPGQTIIHMSLPLKDLCRVARCQISNQIWVHFGGSWTEDDGISYAIWYIYGHLVHFEAVLYILLLFGIFSPFLACCTKKNLATLDLCLSFWVWRSRSCSSVEWVR